MSLWETYSRGGAILLLLHVALALLASGHAVLVKRDPRSAWAWITACWLFPLLGVFLYYLLGINRVETRARRMRPRLRAGLAAGVRPLRLPDAPGASAAELHELVRIGEAMGGNPLAFGNRVEPLCNGDEAYPAMLQAIAGARDSVYLASYIFETGVVGRRFVQALAQAQARGARVRVLVDGVADLYYWPSPSRLLARHGVRAARFLPLRALPPMLHINLRNHRKLLVVDGAVAFTGGMNIGDHHVVRRWRRDSIADLHFRIEGPVVRQLEQVFIEDWQFAAREELPPAPGTVAESGRAACRAVADGPNEDIDKLLLIILSALAQAHHQVRIMTPYFIPAPELMGALRAAALRGVEVSIVLPRQSDQRWVDWAARKFLPPLLQRQVCVYLQPAPFAHTKLFLVDDYYALVGSANMDQRSLRLNFELVVEVYDAEVLARLVAHFEQVRRRAQPLSLAALERRPLPVRLRDGLCWLFSPYL